jgi:maltose alpha-D-glucosyltransferase/alpha-amylase
MKRMLLVRKTSQAFGRGTLRFIRPGNRKVLVYLREYNDDTILCVVNLSRSAQPVEINLADQKGKVPIELLGSTTFPPIGELPYFLTLPAYGFYWFRLSREAQAPPWHDERMAPEDLPVLVLVEGWNSFFPERVATWRAALAARLRSQLETRVIPQFVVTQRWYAGKGQPILSAKLIDHGARENSLDRWLATIFAIENSTETSHYFIPLAIATEDGEEARWKQLQPAAIARVRQQATVGVLADACLDENFCRVVVDAIGNSSELATELGHFRAYATRLYPELRGDPATVLHVTPGPGHSSNTTVRVGDQLFLKIYRKLQPGINPELEIGRYLTEVVQFPNIVPVAGAVEYQTQDGIMTLALLQAFVTNQGDGWDYTINYLVRFLEDRRTGSPMPEDAHGLYLAMMKTLAIRTAELHVALSRPTSDPAFAPEPITAADIATWRTHALAEADKTLEMLANSTAAGQMPPEIAAEAESLLKRRALLVRRIEACAASVPKGLKTRRHGDYHLGQVLVRRNDFILVDFEGEPARPLAERRSKHSPLTDVAGMLRSFAYARRGAVMHNPQLAAQNAKLAPFLEQWEQQTRKTFIAAYDDVASTNGLYESLDAMRPLLRLFEIEKALYEVRYELNNRPDWASIPLRSLIAFAE